jgi:membrane-associated phospholipid phosphatase
VHAAAVLLSNALNPSVAILALGALIACCRSPRIGVWIFGTAAGLALSVALAEYGKSHQIWTGHAEFPSGHEAFGASLATSLVVLDRRWAPAAAVIAAALAWALVSARYHAPIDVLAAALLAVVVTTLTHVGVARAYLRTIHRRRTS